MRKSGEGWAAGFPPVEPKRARVLILGTLPSAESIRKGEYYAHPRNAFWPIMGELFGAGRELPYAPRLRKLASRGVMLWDVLQAAHRPGSLDSAIHPRRLKPNEIPELLARHPELEKIVFNGGPAEALFRRHVAKKCGDLLAGVELVRLPSTSPAHASRTFAQKLAAWRAGLPPPKAMSPASFRV
ncbi:MAG TPA: DNA-deoxyinosine glycosylase [Verrucomicrobia bacterium]|nr:DNA-deoxyinosine glycosylase [Verrucomicrobiota bacterium]